jgi:diguanylate cyclase
MSVATLSQFIILTCQGVGVMAFLAIGFGSIQRLALRRPQRSVLQGIVFGIGAVALSLSPVRLDGVPIDGRAIFVGLAGAFAGLPAMLVAATLSIGARYWIFGMAAPLPALTAILGGFIGFGWLRFIRPRLGVTTQSLALLGVMISSTLLLALMLPRAQGLKFLSEFGPVIMGAAVLGSIVFGSLLKRELSLISREKVLEAAAMRDPLTGLRNRRSFDAEVIQTLAQDNAACLLIVDLDHFKRINDQYGHAVGDLALRAVALALQSSVRREDIVGRIGGEEFGILLPEIDIDSAIAIAGTIGQRIQKCNLKADGLKVAVTASIGLALAGPDDTDATLFSAADAALYTAKRDGRNCVRIASSPESASRSTLAEWAA